MHRILSEQTISITELRKNPAQYFTKEPIAVLSNNKPAGYMVSAELFEKMTDLLQSHQNSAFANFSPTATQLKEIAAKGNDLLNNQSEQFLAGFEE